MHVYIIILTILCRLKVAEFKKRQIGDIGFINTNLMDEWNVKHDPKDPEFLTNKVSVTVLCIFSFPSYSRL